MNLIGTMQLKKLLHDVSTIQVEGPLEREVTGITYDSRRVTPGMVFVAIFGQKVDGHQFINTAIDRGASAIICERNGFSSLRATKIKVPDSREALAHVAAAFYQRPADSLKIIGVTGTNGKTTVAFMVKQILDAAGVNAGLIGTVRYEIGERVIPAHRTTPEALEIHQMLSQMIRAGCKACVMEVSSHALEQKRVVGLDFDAAVFTNLTQDHLDFHGTMEAYYQAKKKLFTGLSREQKKGAAIINIDDAFGKRMHGELGRDLVLGYGTGPGEGLRATNVHLGKTCCRFNVQAPGVDFRCELPLIGRHNIYNALAAAGAALALEVDPVIIQEALECMEPVPGRLESISVGQPFGVFVDYAHTDDALRNVLTTLREITPGRLLVAFGCGGSRDTGKRAKMGKVAAELANYTIITSDNPRKEDPEAIAAQIEAGYRDQRADGYRLELDRRSAIEEIIRMARFGDNVLIAGKGHETYQEFEDTVVPFDDRIYARETLDSVGYAQVA
jgi:UDP-N-acetylmuramoyl-L-alanyl-D-glutamate--2,6-diaminopimelate ligase